MTTELLSQKYFKETDNYTIYVLYTLMQSE